MGAGTTGLWLRATNVPAAPTAIATRRTERTVRRGRRRARATSRRRSRRKRVTGCSAMADPDHAARENNGASASRTSDPTSDGRFRHAGTPRRPSPLGLVVAFRHGVRPPAVPRLPTGKRTATGSRASGRDYGPPPDAGRDDDVEPDERQSLEPGRLAVDDDDRAEDRGQG